MSQRVRRSERKRRQVERSTATGPWRIRCDPGHVVYLDNGEPMRFETQEAAERRIEEAGWDGFEAVLIALPFNVARSGRTRA
jgi:hypothetical protein